MVPSPTPLLEWTLEKSHSDLSIYRSGRNLKIVLGRPKNGNALTANMVEQVTDCFRRSASDDSVSRIVITAEGRFFCTGMDLGKESSAVGKGGDAAGSEFAKFSELFETIRASPKVTIAAINGPCYAGGIGLAFSCDIRLAVGNASATLSEVKLGLCPAIISKYLLHEWGVAFTREAMLSGRTIPMAELRYIGTVHGLADDPAGLDRMVDSYLADLRRCAPGASALCKDAVRAGGQADQEEVIEGIFRRMMRPDAESAIGLRNFQAKKPTDWDMLDTVSSKL
ncbi:hypothetical protein AJ80_07612 [Polytolypa hystricis UAMH7299]|uniref:Enoyl-CoA hydratase n=1 Tax=Polytolypa hystricis (strain UAMH7299) TaxID=1447883 RepID=A0A2B7XMM4_POLH7|nr:hypothetical protein AJ80_07612 [Polytolypa hystricis UAMH7299]